ncbi:hypothetical protein ABFS83_14G044000 [Erythranthe nasuta]
MNLSNHNQFIKRTMASTHMNNFFYIFVIFFYLVHMIEATSFLRKHHIHIYNELPTNYASLFVYCASKDDVVANQRLNSGEQVSWSFRSNWIGTTLYFCRFQWGSKRCSFDVFRSNWLVTYRVENYLVREDGFYHSNGGEIYGVCYWS